MLHKDILSQLMPLEISGDAEGDQVVEGAQLDVALERDVILLQEVFADTANELLADWERVCGLTPASGTPLQLRQWNVIRKLRELGDIKIPYFVTLAASLGFDVEITTFNPFMAGWACVGDTLYVEDSWWQWNVAVPAVPTYYFQTGQSVAGELLSWWPPATSLESLFNDLKPADVFILFTY